MHSWVWLFTGVLPIFSLIMFIVTSMTNPGIIPRAKYEMWLQQRPGRKTQLFVFRQAKYRLPGQPLQATFCQECMIIRPFRAHHCGRCDNCVEWFDHHCPWLANCIGRWNYKYFMCLLTSICAEACWGIIISVWYISWWTGALMLVNIVVRWLTPDAAADRHIAHISHIPDHGQQDHIWMFQTCVPAVQPVWLRCVSSQWPQLLEHQIIHHWTMT